jgi:hypothetical protein
MLAKINELNRNVVLLLSVGIIAITAVIVTLLAVYEPKVGSADPLSDIQQFQKHFEKEYGTKPTIHVMITPDASESKSKDLAEDISSDMKLGDVSEDDTLSGWYNAENKKDGITLTVISK